MTGGGGRLPGCVTRIYRYLFRRGILVLVGERLSGLTGRCEEEHNGCPMQVKLAALADYALVSRDGKLSILGIFDQVNLPALPFGLPQMWLVVSLEGEPSEIGRQFQLDLLLWDSDGNQLFAHENTFMFMPPNQPGLRSTHNEVIGLHGMRFNTAGDHSFIIRVNGEERRRLVLRVAIAPQGAPQT